MSTFTLSRTAYAKVKLHAFKYPHCEVTGLLLANQDTPYEITDAIPLFHQGNKLLPMIEVAFQQVENIISNKNKQSSLDKNEIIVGYYEIPVHLGEVGVSAFAQRIGDRINQVMCQTQTHSTQSSSSKRKNSGDADSISNSIDPAGEKDSTSRSGKTINSTLILSMHNQSGRFNFYVKRNVENNSGNSSYSDAVNSQKWLLEEVRKVDVEEYNEMEVIMKNLLREISIHDKGPNMTKGEICHCIEKITHL